MASINDVLTDREVEVLRLAASGKKDWQVAEELKVSTSTITTYWYRIKMKLSVRSRSEAIALYATLRVAPSDQWGESGDSISQRSSSRQWSDLGAPFVTYLIDQEGKFRNGSGSVIKYVGTSGKPPSDDQWNRFIQQTVGHAGLKDLRDKGRFHSRSEIGDKTFEVYALVSNTQGSKSNLYAVTAIDVTGHIKLQNELHEERDYFKSVLDQAPNMYFIWDFNQSAITYVNHFAHHVLGYSPEKFKALGPTVFDLIHPDDREGAMARISQISHMRKGDIQVLPIRVKTLEGKYVSFNTVSTPFTMNEDGSVREFLCACFDIASYHERLDKLENEHKRFLERYELMAAAVKNTAVGLLTIDLEGRILSANAEGLRLLGADRDGWQDIYDLSAKGPDNDTKFLELGKSWLTDKILSIKPTESKVVELPNIAGRICRYLFAAGPVRNAQGDVYRYTITFYDFAYIVKMYPDISAGIANLGQAI